MNNKLKDNFEKVIIAYAVLDKAQNYAKLAKAHIKNHYAHTVNVSSRDYVYDEMQRWIYANSPLESQKNLVVSTKHHSDGGEELAVNPKTNGVKNEYKLIKYVDTEVLKKFTYKGNQYTVHTTTPEKLDASKGAYAISFDPPKMVINCYNKVAQNNIINLLAELQIKKQLGEKQVQLMTERYSDWYGADLQPRSLESVFLPQNQKDRIVKDLQQFLDAEADYTKFNMPWHRGYLFYGPAGTGKTSLCKALAHEFKMNIHYISLSEITKDSNLINLIKAIPPKSILLLEDIDVLQMTHNRESEGNELTLTGLLNALDGVATPHGLITFMTTNYKNKLDAALVRSGRVDLKESIDYATNDQIKQAYQYFYNKSLTTVLDFDKVSLSDVMEVFKQNMYDGSAAQKALIKLKENNDKHTQSSKIKGK